MGNVFHNTANSLPETFFHNTSNRLPENVSHKMREGDARQLREVQGLL